MFEITSIAAKDTFTVELMNANDEPLFDADGKPISVTVYGPGSKHHQRAQARRTQLMLDRMAKKGKMKLTAEEQQKEQAEFLAACTVSFNGFAYNGATTPEAIVAAYSDTSIGFIADQVAKALGDWANFTNSSAKS
jgi:hypothetical protein